MIAFADFSEQNVLTPLLTPYFAKFMRFLAILREHCINQRKKKNRCKQREIACLRRFIYGAGNVT